jgi:superfamily I DNA and/or RNA helicase
LQKALFERLMQTGDAPSKMLNEQYRMHAAIMEFPNRLMYGGALKAHPSVADRRFSGGDRQKAEGPTWLFAPDRPVVFVDTADTGLERLPERSTSYENPVEAEAVASWVRALVQSGVPESAIGVITPYLSQAKRIRRLLDTAQIGVEVKSVDGFQGREKEVVNISFVRANRDGAIGFVRDARRLNVAMTRAKSKLVMIGNKKTLQTNAPFDALFAWLQTRENACVTLPEPQESVERRA